MFTLAAAHPPNAEQVLALLAGAPPPFPSLLARGVHAHANTATAESVAAILGTTAARVKRIAKAYRLGGINGANALNWVAGRPLKPTGFCQDQIEEMVSRPTMYNQAGLSMSTRADQVSQQYGTLVTKEELRRLYHGRGITRQSIRPSYAAGNIPLQSVQHTEMV
jgi:transposase